METNKEQQPKHTHEPWILHNDNQHDQTHKSGWFCGDDKPFGYLLSEEDFNHAAKCVNALEGIEDPERWVSHAHSKILELDDIQVEYEYVVKERNEYEKYKTACEQINPDNPMAVAESLGEMYIILKEAEPMFYDAKLLHTKNGVHQEFLEEDIILIQRLKNLLTKIQSK